MLFNLKMCFIVILSATLSFTAAIPAGFAGGKAVWVWWEPDQNTKAGPSYEVAETKAYNIGVIGGAYQAGTPDVDVGADKIATVYAISRRVIGGYRWCGGNSPDSVLQAIQEGCKPVAEGQVQKNGTVTLTLPANINVTFIGVTK